MEIGRGWGYSETTPWREDETPTDLAVFSNACIALTTVRDGRSALYLVERENLTYSRKLALPCIEPQIVAHGPGTIWLTGISPSSGPRRCDLLRVDVERGAVTVVTAELPDIPAIDVAASEDAKRVVIATPRAAFATYASGGTGLLELVELTSDETITAMACCGATSAVFVRGNAGCRVVLGRGEATLALKAPSWAARFTKPAGD